jgi:hypothetical protein
LADETIKGSGTTQEAKLGFEPKTSYVPGYPPGDEEGNRDEILFNQLNRDLSVAARKTLGNFLSDMTAGKRQSPSANAFLASDGSSEAELYNRETGLPVDLNPTTRQGPTDTVKEYEEAGATLGAFLDLVEGYDVDAANKFNSTNQGDYGSGKNPFYNADDFGEVLYNKNERKGGHTLLPNVKAVGAVKEVGNAVVNELPEDAPSVQKRISNVLLNNRFNPKGGASPFLTNFEKTGGKFGYSVQKDMGSYHAGTDQAPDVSIDDLKKIGASLMIRASGHGGPMGFGFESDDPDDVNLLQVFLPSTTQLGLLKPSVVELRAQNAFGAENITKIRSEMLSELNESESEIVGLGAGAANSTSYGNLNSHLEPFGGPLPSGMIWQAIGGIIALLAFSALVNLIVGGFWWDDEEDPINLTMLTMGRHMPDHLGMDLAGLFNIPIVDSSFTSCMMYGIMSFCGFSFDPMSSAPQKILDGAINIGMAPGYYAVIFRTILRDVGAMVSTISDLATKLPTIGIMGGIESVFSIITAVSESATWRFLMLMVRIGNSVLYSRHGHPRLYDPDVDLLPEGPRTRHMKSKLSLGVSTTMGGSTVTTNALAWRHSANVSRYILPASLDHSLKAMDMSPGKTTGLMKASMPGSFAQDDGKASEQDIAGKGNIFEKFEDKETAIAGRLSSEYVRYIEDALDSEYMPFYFHDLRTNEIISFHAFMNSLTDSFSPDWNEVDGYGRMDSVKIYNKTSRTISLDFTVVSTSEQDFDRMWYDINKLVTMVYPQWSKGRARTQGDSGYIQPFSQIPTASPVIRLRFGDLIKSNYSKFNLSRLFGVGTTAFKVAADADDASKRAEWSAASNKAKKKMGDHWISSNTIPLDPESGGSPDPDLAAGMPSGLAPAGSFPVKGYQKGDIVIIKPRRSRLLNKDGYYHNSSIGKRKIKSGYWKGEVVNFYWTKKAYKFTKSEKQAMKLKNVHPTKRRGRAVNYIIKILPPYTDVIPPELKKAKHEFLGCYFENIDTLHKDTLDNVWRASMKEQGQETPPKSGGEAKDADKLTKTGEFFTAKDNFIVKAFESTRGRGMAGVITDLSFDWGDATWDTAPGRRAPQWLKVSLSFSPIHDLPLGLDHDGAMRAPAYNVGRVVEAIGGDPYAEKYARDGNSPNEQYFAKVSKHVNDNPAPIEDDDVGGKK